MTAIATSTRERMAPPRQPVTYQKPWTVEGAVRRLLGCRSEGAAHQRILRARAELPLILRGFLEAGARARLSWFMEPAENILANQPTPALTPALLREAMELDGREDVALVDLASHLADPTVARATLRDIRREIAAKEQLFRAICAKHGWQA